MIDPWKAFKKSLERLTESRILGKGEKVNINSNIPEEFKNRPQRNSFKVGFWETGKVSIRQQGRWYIHHVSALCPYCGRLSGFKTWISKRGNIYESQSRECEHLAGIISPVYCRDGSKYIIPESGQAYFVFQKEQANA